jgi:hypothetical protein
MVPLSSPQAVVVGSYRRCHGRHVNIKTSRVFIPSTFQALRLLAAVLITMLILTANMNMASAIEVDTGAVTKIAKSKTARGGLRGGSSSNINHNYVDNFQSTTKTPTKDFDTQATSTTASTIDRMSGDEDGEAMVASDALLTSESKSISKYHDLDIEDEDDKPESPSGSQIPGPSELDLLQLTQPNSKQAQPLSRKSALATWGQPHIPLAYPNSTNYNQRAPTVFLRGNTVINLSESLHTEAMAGKSKEAIKTKITLTTGMPANLTSMNR